jgi:CRP/FNR family transcriptional regulator
MISLLTSSIDTGKSYSELAWVFENFQEIPMQSSQGNLEILGRIGAFRDLSNSRREALATAMVRRTYMPGQLIFLEGDPSCGLWFIVEGRVRIIKQSRNGRVQGLCLVDRGKCFGSCPLFDGDRNPANAQAIDNVTLLVLPSEALQRFVQQEPDVASVLLRIFSQRLSHLAKLGEGLGTREVGHRINDCILAYAEERAPHPVVSLTHDKLASMAGTVREVVTRHLAKLESEGVVRVEPGQIIVLDADALEGSCLSAKS